MQDADHVALRHVCGHARRRIVDVIARIRTVPVLLLVAVLVSMTTLVPAARGHVGEGEPLALSGRELAAPPEDIQSGVVRLGPSPLAVSDHALVPVTASLDPVAQGALGRVTFDHAVATPPRDGLDPDGRDEAAGLSVVVAMQGPGPWSVALLRPDGTQAFRDGVAPPLGVSVRTGDLGPTLKLPHTVNALRIDVAKAEPGRWQVELRAPRSNVGATGVVVVGGGAGHQLRGRFESRVSRVGVERTFLCEADGTIDDLRATVRDPSGAERQSTISGQAMTFVPTSAGAHRLQISATVRGVDGQRASRTIETFVDVAESTRAIRGDATMAPLDALRHTIRIPTTGEVPEGPSEVVLVAAEVWVAPRVTSGSTAQHAAQPIAWLANLVPLVADPSGAVATLTFDRRWLSRASLPATLVAGELELRNVRLMNREGRTLVDLCERIPLGPVPEPAPFDPREESSLLRGRPGGHPLPSSVSLGAIDDATPGSHALMLVHGYCSDGAPFPANHFTGAVANFFDPDAARSNDEFAQLIGLYGAGFKSYGTVAHSQGGLASLHLYTFYWSGLDWATGPRLIQSVGAPYQGTPLAGNLAVLGGIFGVGCGEVFDMTPEGATAWLANIPTWARQKVWYWTTSYKDFPFSYDYCDFISDLFLSNPDDGVIEKSKGQLPGANNMGHVEGWCHTTGMEDPAQCTDATRNAQMNANAAR